MKTDPHRIVIVGGGHFPCRQDERVLIAMERHGANYIGIGCRGGGCGFCRVRVVGGEYRVARMSTVKVSAADQEKGFVLACQLYPLSDLLIEVVKS